MGRAGKRDLRVGFDRAFKLEFHGAKVSSDAGLFLSISKAAYLGWRLAMNARRVFKLA